MTLTLSDLALAVRSTLTTHLPAHLADLSRPRPAPATWHLVPTSDNIRQVKGVAGGVSANSPSEPPKRRSDGGYDAWCRVDVFLFHENKPAHPVDLAPADYAAAMAGCLVHHSSLDGFASGFELTTFDSTLVGDGLSSQTLGLATVECSFLVKGLLIPTAHGQPVLGTVQSTNTTVTRL